MSADDRRSEVILLIPSPEIRNHVRALLEMDGYETSDAKDAEHAQELARAASAFAVLVQPESKLPLERLEATLEKCAPNVDVLKPAGFGHALIEGTLDRRRTLFGLDALALLAGLLERSAGRTETAERISQWAELTAIRLGLSPVTIETVAVTALLAALGPCLARFRFGVDSKSGAEGGVSQGLRAALAAAATLRTPYNLQAVLSAVEERFDGRGRPHGLAGVQIPIASRVVAATTDYAAALARESDATRALTLLTSGSGTDYDPQVVQAFCRVLRANEYVERVAEARGGASIAVVDGDPAALAVAELRLSAAGFKVRAYLNGRVARDSLATFPPDAVISEIVVPGFDGVSLLMKMRREEATAHIPFFFVSGSADRNAVTKALKLGANDVMAKPPHFDVLIAKLREATAKVPEAQAKSGTVGDLAELGLVDLLQVIALGRKSASVHLEGTRGYGTITLERGEPLAAATRTQEGLDAFCEMAGWTEGRFRMEAGGVVPQRNLNGSLEALLLEAMHRLDQAHRPVGEQPRGTRRARRPQN